MVALPSGDGLILSSSHTVSLAVGEVLEQVGPQARSKEVLTSTIEERAGLEPDTQPSRKRSIIVRPAAPCARRRQEAWP